MFLYLVFPISGQSTEKLLFFPNTGQILADIACDDETLPLTLYNETNILETPDYPVADHPDGTQCQWILQPENNVNVRQTQTVLKDLRVKDDRLFIDKL